MPEQTQTPQTLPASAPTVEQILQARNIDAAKLGEILDGYSRDVPELRQKAKMTEEERRELADLRKQKADADAAQLSELDRARKAQADAEKLAAQYQADIKARDRRLLLEQHISEVTRGQSEAVATLFAEYVRATIPAQPWETSEELKPLMIAQLDRWKALAPTAGGGSGIPYGAPGVPGQGGPMGSAHTPPEAAQATGVPFIARFRAARRK